MRSTLLILTFMMLSIETRGQLLKKTDTFVGGRVALGSVAGASAGFAATGEYGFDNDLGLIAVIGYSGYTDDFGYGERSHTNVLLMGGVSYHHKLIQDEKFDTFGSVAIGYNVASTSWKWKNNPLNLGEPSASVGGIVIGFSANLRYFLSPQWAVTGSIGYGLGVLSVGADYRIP
ncbi:MAG TPA: hypothetical protein VNN76_11630 [Bacteroidota bacterium]|nr:hypothetical protein [Bacteroidota bacterium]